MLLFLSHAGDESSAAQAIASDLRRAGLEVWLDTETLKPGDRWMEQIEAALGRADCFGVYIGPSGIRRWVDREVRAALQRQTTDPSFRIIPILGPGAEPEALPPFLAQHSWLDLRNGTEPERIRALVAGILGGASIGPALIVDEVPFRGLEAFDVEHAHLFFGRDGDIDALLHCLRRDAFLAVVGSSGSGKSSLVRAGLIPALERGRFHDGTRWSREWRIGIIRPGSHPFHELATMLGELLPDISPRERIRLRADCERRLSEGTRGLASCLSSLVPRGARTLIVIDQFEETFTLSDPAERIRFVSTLLDTADLATDRPIHIVVTLRADFYSHCWQHPALPLRIAHNQHAVGPLDRPSLRAVIEKPLVLAGVRIEPGLVDVVLDDVGDEPGNLPLLEHSLLRLWDRRSGDMLTHHAYQAIGKAQGAIAHHADSIFTRLDEQQQELARKIFLHLIRPGDGTTDMRRRVSKRDLVAVGSAPAAAEAVLNVLLGARLLAISRKPDDPDDLIDVAHEALIQRWPRLRKWVDADRDSLRTANRLVDAVAEWESLDRDPSVLYRGVQLAQAEEWAQRRWNDLTAGAQAFMTASLAARDRESKEQEERQRRELEKARQLASQAFAALSAREAAANPTRALLFAVESVRRANTYEAEDALRAALAAPQRHAILGLNSSVARVEFSPDGRRLLTMQGNCSGFTGDEETGADFTPLSQTAPDVILWDVESGSRVTVMGGHTGGVRHATHSPDGRTLVTVGNDALGRVWNASTGALLTTLEGHTGSIVRSAYSPDGRRLVTGSEDRTARLWDSATGEQLAQFAGHENILRHVAYSPTGRQVATAANDGTARIWSTANDRDAIVLQHNAEVVFVEFSPDGRIVLTGSYDSTARLWDTATGKRLRVLDHGASLYSGRFSPDGTQVAVAALGSVSVWTLGDVRDAGSRVHRVELTYHGSGGRTIYAEFSPDGGSVVSVGEDGTVRQWASATGEPLAVLRAHRVDVFHATFSPDGRRIATASLDGTVDVWWVGGETLPVRVQRGTLEAAVFSPNATLVASAGKGEAAIHLSDATSAEPRTILRGGKDGVRQLVYRYDGRMLLIVGRDRTPRLWDTANGQLHGALSHPAHVAYADFDATGSRIATGAADGTTRVWDVASGKTIAVLSQHKGPVRHVGFSADGQRAVTVGLDDTARTWNAETGQQLTAHTQPKVAYAGFSPDGTRLVTTGEDGGVRLWEADTGKEVSVLSGHQAPVWHALFLQGGQRIITSSWDSTARVWDAATGRSLAVLEGHANGIHRAVLSADGQHVATMGLDGTVCLWNASDGRLLSMLRGHSGTVLDVAFIDDRVRTVAEDGTVRTWFLNSRDLVRLAESRFPVGFDHERRRAVIEQFEASR